MKLRNKKTGKIIDLDEWSFDTYNNMFYIARDDAEGDNIEYFKSFADFNSKYEDYEEPKEYWYIDYCGCICNSEEDPVSPVFILKEIGNYFESEEEAEKAVEKLKAWKRLKDKGFKFKGVTPMEYFIRFTYDKPRQILDNQQHPEVAQQFNEDINILFGGE